MKEIFRKQGDRRVAFPQKIEGAIDTPEGVHLFFGEMMWATDPSVGGDTVSHARINVVPVVVLLQPIDVVVVISASGIRQLEMIEAVSLTRWHQMQFANHFGLITGCGQFTCQGMRRVPLCTSKSYTTVGCRARCQSSDCGVPEYNSDIQHTRGENACRYDRSSPSLVFVGSSVRRDPSRDSRRVVGQ
ncbi:hypothetical protein GBAR_LOCUS20660 [Geodia barretti]|uniref:Uncharacterized protein n=1 Tax=Geodia barretti TaxID=519541 RepID=A0AA35SWX5_GEOBA|nr:hypothetical protein GBAR_LOCUS20660 [Geodia barretti]